MEILEADVLEIASADLHALLWCLLGPVLLYHGRLHLLPIDHLEDSWEIYSALAELDERALQLMSSSSCPLFPIILFHIIKRIISPFGIKLPCSNHVGLT